MGEKNAPPGFLVVHPAGEHFVAEGFTETWGVSNTFDAWEMPNRVVVSGSGVAHVPVAVVQASILRRPSPDL